MLQELRPAQRLRGALPLLGPAFVASVAYVDPGNFATNVESGSRFGYRLLWVIVVANLMAVLVQLLSAKLGAATGRNLPELCRQHLPRPVTLGLWAQAEVVAMATDLAEIVGGALALNLLFGVPLPLGGVITAAGAFGLLALQERGYRRFEGAVIVLLGVILVGLGYDVLRAGVDPAGLAAGLVPGFEGRESVLLSTGILGATVMPHVIYLHSALTQDRVPASGAVSPRRAITFQRVDVVIAMGLAGIVNAAMLVIAAGLFNAGGRSDVTSIEGAHEALGQLVSPTAALAFALALLASGFASSSVGTYAGQVIMQGFLRRSIPLLARRAVTMAPALAVLGLGLDPTRSLVISQVVLSFGIPFALVPLVWLTRRRDVMGAFANAPLTNVLACAVAGVIIALNAYLLTSLLTG